MHNAHAYLGFQFCFKSNFCTLRHSAFTVLASQETELSDVKGLFTYLAILKVSKKELSLCHKLKFSNPYIFAS